MRVSEGQDHVRKRLEALIHERGESFAAISRRIGRNPAYIQQFIRRGVPRRLSEQDRARLARHFRVSELELGGSPGENSGTPESAGSAHHAMLVPESGSHEVSEPHRVSVVIIPFLDCPAAMAPNATAPAAAFVLEAAIAQQISSGRPGNLGALVADGDSMAPTIQHGDYLLFDKAQQCADRHGLYVVQGPRAPMVRRIAIDPIDGTASMLADNPAYPAQTRCDPDAIPVVGRIIWSGKLLG